VRSNFFVELIKRTYKKFEGEQAFFEAGAVAFFALFSIFPIILFSLSLLAIFVRGTEAERFILETIGRAIPSGGDVIRQIISQRVNRVGISIIAIIGFLYGGAGVFTALELALNKATHPQRIRTTIQDYEMAIGMSFLIGLLTLFGFLIQLVTTLVSQGQFLGEFAGLATLFNGVLPWIITIINTAAIILFIYLFVPSKRLPFKWLWPGWLFSTVIVSILQGLFFIYVRYASFDLFFGPIASLIVFLLWIYYSTLVVIIGAQLNDARRHILERSEERRVGKECRSRWSPYH